MISYLGDFSEDATVYIPFNTFDSNDPSASVTATTLVDADIKVHKDGSVTQIVTDGATIAIDFDTVTGNHLITVDTSVHADYATGSDYLVRIEGATVDGGNINAWVGQFSIENRHSAGALRPTVAGRTLDVSAGGEAGIDWANVGSPTTAVDLSGTDIQLCDTTTTNTDMVAAAPSAASVANAVWDEAQADHVGVGTFGVIASELADVLADTADLQANQGNWLTLTGAATAAALATAQTDLDTLTGTDGATLATTQGNYTPSTAAALATAQTDLDTLTGTDGATLATAQANYAPATAAAVAALNDVSVADILTTQMTESYNTDGAAPTLAQALHLVIAYLTERSVTGTTVTAKKLDGSTTAATFTLNDGTTPTSVTRAT